ncbi:hypothetical protein BCR36DRAFT_586122 [Piromyces finnis]|uniref:Replication protein A C-terminal domain-containing protein n=1 Tax=Piromyces finnis TaxID=1754191 RepID=A0A1Y1V0H1_9FUNG|nr:hypothetical protein BCR36DRAFT_586122 [Piromyces finnis]|eukprot:ORX44506.1 hypothetical protein BCR36DRAFT_586122 [Piromyces finnis]
MLKATNSETFSIKEYEYEELKTHRMLFIHDILSPEITILHNKEHQIFQIGNPKFNFQFIRILGLVTDINEDTLWIDDSTGCISVKLPINGLYSNKLNIIHSGCQLEVLGCLKEIHNKSINKIERYIEGKSFNIKNDPIYEILRSLEIIKLYKENYFSGIHKPKKVTSIMLEDEDDVNDIKLSTYPGQVNPKKRKLEEEKEENNDSDNYSDFDNSIYDFEDITNIESSFRESENQIFELLKKYPNGLSFDSIHKKLNIPNEDLNQSLQNLQASSKIYINQNKYFIL